MLNMQQTFSFEGITILFSYKMSTSVKVPSWQKLWHENEVNKRPWELLRLEYEIIVESHNSFQYCGRYLLVCWCKHWERQKSRWENKDTHWVGDIWWLCLPFRPRPTIAMGKLWCLAIEHDMTPLGRLFDVDYDDNDSISMLKEKVKAKKSNACKNVDADCLTVWQCKDRNIDFDTDDDEIVKSQVRQVLKNFSWGRSWGNWKTHWLWWCLVCVSTPPTIWCNLML